LTVNLTFGSSLFVGCSFSEGLEQPVTEAMLCILRRCEQRLRRLGKKARNNWNKQTNYFKSL